MNPPRNIVFTEDDDGYRIKIEAPGISDLSAPIHDPVAFIVDAAGELGLEVDDSQNVDGRGPVTISVVDA